MDDVVLNKAAVIERCIQRVRQEQAGLETDLARQDSVILNRQRACEAAIDLAMHLVRVESLGVPQESREAFDLLARAGKLPPDLAATMKRMVGFRNIAVRDYQAPSLPIVRSIVAGRLDDLLKFSSLAVRTWG